MTTLPFKPRSAARTLVRLEDVHLTLGNNAILQGIDLVVNQGEVTTIIGPSGSGKSSILRCINGLLTPHQGHIYVGDTAVHELKREVDKIALRKRVGFVFQQYNLFPHLSVLENIMVAPVKILGQTRDRAERLGRRLLKRVRLEHKADSYPGELSGGQQQRVAIARALAMEPELVLFDEVTSALDPETVGEVLTVIRELVNDGMTCILVTHEMRFAQEVSHQVVFTEHGRIVEQGTPEQVFKRPDNSRTHSFINALSA
ncbi:MULTISPECIES: amino acid ABC transporter ATP-binding protein [unclassified Brenneria]|uniref:amino acid ABC transporter ATP-binding protein n=1 Tax=unclassified Brenneria TaxID=2634434 RepID=UPI0018F0D548|nr:amino acid ABC transporter ATP-binding protein [Brenneria sp. L3-3C-1]MBJ7220294.1 amino acid ABC transporter ATP-binding protein [Brenneria sp. L3-3C-1]MEE3641539.1 amino acid ABC transporter ATP-binding protein [Brenneria sp. L3_3C_1]